MRNELTALILLGCASEGNILLTPPQYGPYNAFYTYDKTKDTTCINSTYDSIGDFVSNNILITYNQGSIDVQNLIYGPTCSSGVDCSHTTCHLIDNLMECDTRVQTYDHLDENHIVTYTIETSYTTSGYWELDNKFNGEIDIKWSCTGDCAGVIITNINGTSGSCQSTIHLSAVYSL